MITGMISADADLDELEIGMDMELILEPLHIDEEGDEVIGWKFKPA